MQYCLSPFCWRTKTDCIHLGEVVCHWGWQAKRMWKCPFLWPQLSAEPAGVRTSGHYPDSRDSSGVGGITTVLKSKSAENQGSHAHPSMPPGRQYFPSGTLETVEAETESTRWASQCSACIALPFILRWGKELFKHGVCILLTDEAAKFKFVDELGRLFVLQTHWQNLPCTGDDGT